MKKKGQAQNIASTKPSLIFSAEGLAFQSALKSKMTKANPTPDKAMGTNNAILSCLRAFASGVIEFSLGKISVARNKMMSKRIKIKPPQIRRALIARTIKKLLMSKNKSMPTPAPYNKVRVR